MNYTPIDIAKLEASFQPAAPSEPSRGFNLLLAFFISVLFLFFLFVGSLTAVAYTSFRPPFVDKALSQRIKVYFAFLPVLPKTKEQIVLASSYKTSKVKSFNMNFSGALTLAYSGVDLNLDVKGNTKMNFWDKLESESDFEGKISGSLGEYSASFRTIYIGGNTYLKLDSFPEEVLSLIRESMREYGIELSEDFFQRVKGVLISKWIRVDSPARTAARLELQKREEEDTKRLYQDLGEAVLDIESIKRVKLSKKGDLYIFYTTYTGRELMEEVRRALLKEGKVLTKKDKEFMDRLAEGIKELKVTVEIGRRDYLIKKIVFLLRGEFDISEFIGRTGGVLDSFFGSSLEVDSALTFSFSSINERMLIEEPADFVDFNELYQEIQKEVLKEVYGKDLQSFRIPSGQVRAAARELAAKVEEYRKINGSYPKDINEFILSFPDANLAQKIQRYNIYYISSSDRRSFLVYAPYRVGERGVEYIVYSGQDKSEVLVASELQERVSLLKKDVLGAFIKRMIEE